MNGNRVYGLAVYNKREPYENIYDFRNVPLIPLLFFIDVSMKLNLIKVLRNAPDFISVHRVLLLGTASGFVDKLDNFFAEGTIVQWSPLFFIFVISI